MTRQRRIIHDYLLSTKSHPTAEEIYMNVKKNMPSIAVGTVYRNLSLMTDAGEVRRITVPEHPDRYDGDVSPHDHLLCMKCKKLFDIGSLRARARNRNKFIKTGKVFENEICMFCLRLRS